jgi:hypothetical protein
VFFLLIERMGGLLIKKKTNPVIVPINNPVKCPIIYSILPIMQNLEKLHTNLSTSLK